MIKKLNFTLILAFLSFILASVSCFSQETSSEQKKPVVRIVTPEVQSYFYTGGLGIKVDADARALVEKFKVLYPNTKIQITMPFYMSFYQNPGMVNSIHKTNKSVQVGLDYYYDHSKRSMQPRRIEKFNIYSAHYTEDLEVLFYRHDNRFGERNYFDNKVPEIEPGKIDKSFPKYYSPKDLEMEAFAAFSKAVTSDIYANHSEVKAIILNDWHTAWMAYFLKNPQFFNKSNSDVPFVYSIIHNYAHQGKIFDHNFMDLIGADRRDFHENGFAHQNHINGLKMMNNYSDMVGTVSLYHAKEVLGSMFGFGLEGSNQKKAENFEMTGYLNGIDYRIWDPQKAGESIEKASREKGIQMDFVKKEYHYFKNQKDFVGKKKGKAFLQKYYHLPVNDKAFILTFTSRLDYQKGYSFIPSLLDELLEKQSEIQVVIIGNGFEYSEELNRLVKKYPEQMRYNGYSENEERLLMYYADISNSLSTQEPCGIPQLIGQRTGTVPMVTAVGGLFESVEHDKTGFVEHLYLNSDQKTVNDFETKNRLVKAIERAYSIYVRHPLRWREIQLNGMNKDFSWENAVEGTLNVLEYWFMGGPAILREKIGKAEKGAVLGPKELLDLAKGILKATSPCPNALHDQKDKRKPVLY